MRNDALEFARKLAQIQARLRDELLDELREHGEELDTAFDPYSYSPFVHELRDKYLNRLYLIHGILQQLAHQTQGKGKQTTQVLSVIAPTQRELVDRVNRKLTKLNGSKVTDVKFIPGNDGEDWSAVITLELSPFRNEADETAAWM
jgi:hypothetical protein